MNDWDNLTELHFDALREVGNVGAGNAVASLAQLMQCKIEMDVPRAAFIALDEVFSLIGGEEDMAACINMEVEGRIPATVLFVLCRESALSLVEILLGRPSNSQQGLDSLGQSALEEAGNILIGSMLTALATMIGTPLRTTVPAFAFDMLGAVVVSGLLERGHYEDKVLAIETQFLQARVTMQGHFLFVPKAGCLKVILESLGLKM